MWTAIVGESTLSGNSVETVVTLSDGVIKFQQRYVTDGSLAQLTTAVKATIAVQDERKTTAPVPPGTVLDLTPPPPPPLPTKAEQALLDFRALCATYNDYQRAVDAGMIPPDDPDYLAAQAAAQAAFLPEYIGQF